MFNPNTMNTDLIMKRWSRLVNATGDIKDDSLKLSTAMVLENTQNAIDNQYRLNNSRGLLTEDLDTRSLGVGAAMGPYGDGSLSQTATTAPNHGDARVPSIVIPLIRRIYPNLIAHKLVGVQPMSGPIGMVFAYRAKYGHHGLGGAQGSDIEGTEIGYLHNHAGFTGKNSQENSFAYNDPQAQKGQAGIPDANKMAVGTNVRYDSVNQIARNPDLQQALRPGRRRYRPGDWKTLCGKS